MAPHTHFTRRHYESDHQFGPLSFLNPTTRLYAVDRDRRDAAAGDPQTGPDAKTGADAKGRHKVYTVWRSRDNRKGRHAVAIAPECRDGAGYSAPPRTNTVAETLRGIGRMFTRYPVWDISYDVAIIFTLGSIVWVFNGFFVWLPLAAPSTEFETEVSWGGGLTAFIGATVFEIGSVLLMLEAVNENRADCFGWALEEALAGGLVTLRPEHECHHSHREKRSWLKSGLAVRPGGGEEGKNGQSEAKRTWSWWPSWYELKTHYFHDIGFLACFFQLCGASVFWIAGLTGIPPIYDMLSTPATNGAYWSPQVIGGSGFVISSCLFMLETQHAWYVPNLTVLGWHIGFWNLIGAVGFTLCGALGFGIDQPAVEYASTLSTFIGSWAFLIGSVIQWFESLDKYPISVETKMSRLQAAAQDEESSP